MPSLFDSFDLGPVHLTGRIVMPPMTRTRTSEGALPTDGDLPNELTVKYYGQRASAGLIISEVNDVDQSSHGYARIPGIHSEAQKQAWRPVTEEVHRQGGTIFMQLWHVGRLAHSSLLPNGQAPVGVTAEQAVGSEVFAHGPDGRLRFMAAETPRPLSTEEVTAMVGTFAKAAANAREVGFDGIEIHAANGYLIEQFMNSVLNTRTDRYGGGSMEDRARFLMEVVDAVVAEFGAGRVGVRLSPFGKYGSMPADPLVEETFLYIVEQLGRRGVAYVHLLYELLPDGNMESATFEARHLDHDMLAKARASFPGAFIWCGGFNDVERAQAALDTGLVDLIAFGRPYIANPDLVERLRSGWPLAVADRSVYYTRNGEVGYTDFPTYSKNGAASRAA
ncbi:MULTISPECIES: alkene reductase [unclassified Mesorhizobium]|uniref:alkene reductase n=1 Tax=unclassified Mesorhizobium TaxID=325217 RepID=UPI0011266413|nr:MULTISPECIES: alkene reductase [unclassified Mesorhizobium]TPJ43903.1 alkene reductase [Mesorhizobium sp. B2-6-6]MCA0002234.1 alkene reductase [Mesorhizobium sp. B264B2A]MCA0008935.1 alkene reductase [Mesorhizobium sp. B264B1B]MCA0017068.1 alkene reductase [Mesorhizobium sp. B264B1A]TPM07493.1 alkene reductase [Mesorhizobium sp. B2-3-8]